MTVPKPSIAGTHRNRRSFSIAVISIFLLTSLGAATYSLSPTVAASGGGAASGCPERFFMRSQGWPAFAAEDPCAEEWMETWTPQACVTDTEAAEVGSAQDTLVPGTVTSYTSLPEEPLAGCDDATATQGLHTEAGRCPWLPPGTLEATPTAAFGVYCGPMVPPGGTAVCSFTSLEGNEITTTGLTLGLDQETIGWLELGIGQASGVAGYDGVLYAAEGEPIHAAPGTNGSAAITNTGVLPARVIAHPTNVAGDAMGVKDLNLVGCSIVEPEASMAMAAGPANPENPGEPCFRSGCNITGNLSAPPEYYGDINPITSPGKHPEAYTPMEGGLPKPLCFCGTGGDGAGGSVNVVNGEFVLRMTPLRIDSSRGPDWEFNITYRTLSPNATHLLAPGTTYENETDFGYHWDYLYGRHFVELPDGTMEFHDGDGLVAYFPIANVSGSVTTYDVPRKYYGNLTKDTSLGTLTWLDRYGTIDIYNGFGQLVSTTDRNGNAIRFDYDADGLLRSSIDTHNRVIEFHYDALHRIESISDFAGRAIHFYYCGDVLCQIEGLGGTTASFVYDSNGALTAIYDAKFQDYLQNVYDSLYRVADQRFGNFLQWFNFTYDPGNDMTTVEDRNGNLRDYHYVSQSEPITEQKVVHSNRGIDPNDAPSYTTNYTHNLYYELTEIEHPEGNLVQYTFDEGNPSIPARGNLLAVTDDPGPACASTLLVSCQPRTISYTYENHFNQVLTKADARGNDPSYEPPNGGTASAARYTTTHTYDGNGNRLTVIRPVAHPEGAPPGFSSNATNQTAIDSFTYNAHGQVLTHTSAVGVTERYQYYPAEGTFLNPNDREGFLANHTRDLGGFELVQNFTYDIVGSVTSVGDSAGREVSIEYDERCLVSGFEGPPISGFRDELYKNPKQLGEDNVTVGPAGYAVANKTRLAWALSSNETQRLELEALWADLPEKIDWFLLDASQRSAYFNNLAIYIKDGKYLRDGINGVYFFLNESFVQGETWYEDLDFVDMSLTKYQKEFLQAETQDLSAAAAIVGGPLIESVPLEERNLTKAADWAHGHTAIKQTNKRDPNGLPTEILSQRETQDAAPGSNIQKPEPQAQRSQYNILGHLTLEVVETVPMLPDVPPSSLTLTRYHYDYNDNHVCTEFPLAVQAGREYNIETWVYNERDLPYLHSRANRGLVLSVNDGGLTCQEFCENGEGSVIACNTKPYDATSYDGNGNPVQFVDGSGNAYTWAYDGFDEEVLALDPEGTAVHSLYDPAGHLVEERIYKPSPPIPTTPSGLLGFIQSLLFGTTPPGELESWTRYSFDERDRQYETGRALFDDETELIEALLGDHEAIVFSSGWTEHDAMDRVARTIDPNGNPTDTLYDAVGRVVLHRDAGNNSVEKRYDNSSNVVWEKQVENSTDGSPAIEYIVEREFDSMGRLTNETDSNGRRTIQTYDANGRATAAKNEGDFVHKEVIDGAGRQIVDYYRMGTKDAGYGKMNATFGIPGYRFDLGEDENTGNFSISVVECDQENETCEPAEECAPANDTECYEIFTTPCAYMDGITELFVGPGCTHFTENGSVSIEFDIEYIVNTTLPSIGIVERDGCAYQADCTTLYSCLPTNECEFDASCGSHANCTQFEDCYDAGNCTLYLRTNLTAPIVDCKYDASCAPVIDCDEVNMTCDFDEDCYAGHDACAQLRFCYLTASCTNATVYLEEYRCVAEFNASDPTSCPFLGGCDPSLDNMSSCEFVADCGENSACQTMRTCYEASTCTATHRSYEEVGCRLNDTCEALFTCNASSTSCSFDPGCAGNADCAAFEDCFGAGTCTLSPFYEQELQCVFDYDPGDPTSCLFVGSCDPILENMTDCSFVDGCATNDLCDAMQDCYGSSSCTLYEGYWEDLACGEDPSCEPLYSCSSDFDYCTFDVACSAEASCEEARVCYYNETCPTEVHTYQWDVPHYYNVTFEDGYEVTGLYEYPEGMEFECYVITWPNAACPYNGTLAPFLDPSFCTDTIPMVCTSDNPMVGGCTNTPLCPTVPKSALTGTIVRVYPGPYWDQHTNDTDVWDGRTYYYGITIHQKWDLDSRLVQQVDGDGYITKYEYDDYNRQVAEILPDGSTTNLTYDANDNVVSVKDPNGNIVNNTYDGVNRIVEVEASLAPGVVGTDHQVFTYDALGRMVSSLDEDTSGGLASVAANWSYDTLGRMVNESVAGRLVESEYDLAGNRLVLTYPAGRKVGYEYDEVHRLRSVRILGLDDGFTGLLDESVAEYEYVGYRPLSRTYGNGVWRNITYDDNATGSSMPLRVEDFTENETLLVGFEYTYDEADHKTSRKHLHAPAHSEAYVLDPVYRLAEYHRGSLTGSNVTTPAGAGLQAQKWNLTDSNDWADTWITEGGGTEHHERDHDARHSLLQDTSTSGTTGYAYDDNGNLLTDGEFDYEWDFRNRLVRITEAGALVHEYRYDAHNRRVQDTTPDGVTNYTLDGSQEIESITDSERRSTIFGPGLDEAILVDTWAPFCEEFGVDCVAEGGCVSSAAGDVCLPAACLSLPSNSLVFAEACISSIGSCVAFFTPVGGEAACVSLDPTCIATTVISDCIPAGATDNVTALLEFAASLVSVPGDRYYYLLDEQMSTVALVDEDQVIVEGYEYTPYGEPIVYRPGGNEELDWGGDDVVVQGGGSAVGNTAMYTGRAWDDLTGLSYFRSRYHSPELGRFISSDTIGIWTDYRNFGNGYAYGASNPGSNMDPFGTFSWGWGKKAWDGAKNLGKNVWEGAKDFGKGIGNFVKDHVREITAVATIALATTMLFVPPLTVIGAGMLIGGAINAGIGVVREALFGDGLGWDDVGKLSMDFTMGAIEGGLMAAGGLAVGAALKGVSATSKFGKLIKVGDDALDARKGFSSVCRNSFTPGTLVALAGGVWTPIEDVEEGDLVMAYDPETGEAGPREVLDLIQGEGLKDLVDITVNHAVITATTGHPFWVASEQAWVDAGDLVPGDVVLSMDGEGLVVDLVLEYQAEATVHNLHIEGIHTYYVQAGDEEVLVHNTACKAGDFASSGLRTKHVGKHADEWSPPLSEDEYVRGAKSLINREPGGPVMGHTRPNGDILRYDIFNNEFAAMRADGTIKSFFRPTEGIQYWYKPFNAGPY